MTKMKIEKNVSKSRYHLDCVLRRLINNKNYDCTKALPAELYLAKRFSISRNTVRKILQQLVDDGVIKKEHGLGSFAIPKNKRKFEQVATGRILVIVNGYRKNPSKLESYVRKLISGIMEYTLIANGEVEIRDRGTAAEKLLEQYNRLRFNGIIWDRPNIKDYPIIEYLRDAQVPQVIISRTVQGVPSIFFDFRNGLKKVIDFLHNIGHKNIGFFDQNLPHIEIFRDRQEYFAKQISNDDIIEQQSTIVSRTNEPTKRLLNNFFNSNPNITVMFISASFLPNLIEYTKKKQWKIPQDLSVIVLGESRYMKLEQQFSRLVEPRKDIGYKAAHLIRILRAGKKLQTQKIFIDGDFIINTSCISPK